MKTTHSNIICDLRFTIHERLLAPVVVFALLLLGLAPSAHAAGPPEAMTFQGFLVDANGNPLATNNPANHPVIFRIFAAPAGGASLWSEQQIVTVDKGNFSVILSEGTPVPSEPKPLLSTVLSTNGADRYVEIKVGTADPMLPRLRLLPSPYAFLSTSANQLVNPAGAPVVTYANSRVEVTGNLFVAPGGIISGNGSGLSGLTPAQIPAIDASKITAGTLADARLSANIPRLSLNNAFAGDVTVAGNLGVGTGTAGATIPLVVGTPGTLGDKLSLYGLSGDHYGFGMQANLLQIHSSTVASDVAFGYGRSDVMVETMRIKGNGNVGIGTNNPTARLEVNGGVKITGANTLEFGAGVAGKEINAGKIGYGAFTPNTLDIVGAGATPATRKVKVTAEGGTDFSGPVTFNGDRLFHFRSHGALDGNGHNGAVSQATGVSTNTHHMAIIGTDCKNGEIYQARALVENGLWVLHAYIRGNDGSALTWRIYTMSVARSLTTTNSSMALAIP